MMNKYMKEICAFENEVLSYAELKEVDLTHELKSRGKGFRNKSLQAQQIHRQQLKTYDMIVSNKLDKVNGFKR